MDRMRHGLCTERGNGSLLRVRHQPWTERGMDCAQRKAMDRVRHGLLME